MRANPSRPMGDWRHRDEQKTCAAVMRYACLTQVRRRFAVQRRMLQTQQPAQSDVWVVALASCLRWCRSAQLAVGAAAGTKEALAGSRICRRYHGYRSQDPERAIRNQSAFCEGKDVSSELGAGHFQCGLRHQARGETRGGPYAPARGADSAQQAGAFCAEGGISTVRLQELAPRGYASQDNCTARRCHRSASPQFAHGSIHACAASMPYDAAG